MRKAKMKKSKKWAAGSVLYNPEENVLWLSHGLYLKDTVAYVEEGKGGFFISVISETKARAEGVVVTEYLGLLNPA